jgi:hypothetical protein
MIEEKEKYIYILLQFHRLMIEIERIHAKGKSDPALLRQAGHSTAHHSRDRISLLRHWIDVIELFKQIYRLSDFDVRALSGRDRP